VLIYWQMFEGPPMLLHPRSTNRELGFGPEIPSSFCSLGEARNSLDFHWNGCLNTSNAKGNTDNQLEMTQRYRRIFQQWSAAFQAFLEQSASELSLRDVKGAAVLRISHRLAAMHFDSNMMAFAAQQTSWDKYRAEHEEIVSLVATIVEASPNTTGTEYQGAPSFSIDMNILAPLYSVAHRCRDPVVRRKAISLLHATPRQEGIWNSTLVARAVERLIEIEEAGLVEINSCHDVPESSRISDLEVNMDLEKRQATIGYARYQSVLKETPKTIIEVFQW